MRRKLCRLGSAAAFLAVGALIFGVLQEILTPSWTWPYFKEIPENALAELEQLEDSDIQSVYLGTSHSQWSIDPMRIYETAGIVTYNLSTAIQAPELSQAMLAECFRTHKPRYVFFDVANLFDTNRKDTYYRYVLDTMPLDENKIAVARSYSELFPEEKRLGAFIGAFLPMYRYHDRWEELRDFDLTLVKPDRNYFLKGFYLNPLVKASSVTIEKVNSIAQINATAEGWIEELEGDKTARTTSGEKLYAPEIDQEAIEALLGIKALCEANGAQLRLIKIPNCIRPQVASSWTEIKSARMKAVSEECGIPFLDMTYDLEESAIGLDWSRDSCDGGEHLNYSGAKKVSDWFAGYLQTECGLESQTDAEYEADLPAYRAACAVAELQMTTDLAAFLKKASEMENVTVFLSAMDDMMRNLSAENRQDLKDFGLQTDFNKLVYSDSYLAVKEGGTVLYEASGNRRLSRSGELANGVSYTVTSCGWRAGAVSSIKLDGEEYSMSKRGINIVVLDNRSGLVLDSVVFDTWNDGSQSGVRNTSSTTKYSPMGSTPGQAYLFEYMDFLLRNGL